jgi:hypothetical protein
MTKTVEPRKHYQPSINVQLNDGDRIAAVQTLANAVMQNSMAIVALAEDLKKAPKASVSNCNFAVKGDCDTALMVTVGEAGSTDIIGNTIKVGVKSEPPLPLKKKKAKKKTVRRKRRIQ